MSFGCAHRVARSPGILVLGLAASVLGCARDEGQARDTDGLASSGSDTGLPGPGGSEPRGFPVSLVDASGRTLVFHRPPTRILSLVPSATRSLVALGVQDRLVGRTDYDTLAALERVPSVGGGIQPSLETIVALRPDLVILFSGASDRATFDRLETLGIRCLGVRPDRTADVRKLIRDLGILEGRGSAADSLLEQMDATLENVRSTVAPFPRVRVAYVLGGSPPWVAGGGTFIDELLSAAGGENVFADLGALYGPVSPEEFLARKIDLIVAPRGAAVAIPTTTIPIERVPSGVEIPGPELSESARTLAAILHPEAFR